MDAPITSFRGDYRFLSNFWPCDIKMDGFRYSSTENAYQAAKTLVGEERIQFTTCTAGQAKRLGRKITIRKDWEEVKVCIMRVLLFQKFNSTCALREALCSTEDTPLIEGNTWGDVFWGMVETDGQWKGQNYLGQLLMDVRYHYLMVEAQE